MRSKAKMLEKIVVPTPFLVGPVNVYLLKGDALTLVDTGPNTEEAKYELKKQLNVLGYQLEDIEQVIVTHHHPDHVGLVDEFFSNATIIGHINNEPWLVKDEQFHQYVKSYIYQFYKEHGAPVEIIRRIDYINDYYLSFSGTKGLDKCVVEGDEIDGHPGWTVIETPGHAQSHICLYNRDENVLIGGDHIISHISSNAILEPPSEAKEERPKTLIQYRHSLQKCADLNVEKVFSGHGDIVENVRQLVEGRFKEQREKANKFKKIIAPEGSTSFAICQHYFTHVYEREPSLTMSEVIGHLDLLEDWGEIISFKQDGLILYKNC